MKLHYIVDRDIWSQNLHLFLESHYVFTDNPKKILVACKFPHEAHLDAWESVEGVEPLTADHHKMLSKIGVQPGHTKEDIIERAGKINRLVRQERV